MGTTVNLARWDYCKYTSVDKLLRVGDKLLWCVDNWARFVDKFIHRLRYCLQVLLQRIGFDYIGGLLARELILSFSLCFQGFTGVFAYVYGVGGYLHSPRRLVSHGVIYGLFRCFIWLKPWFSGVFRGLGSILTCYCKCGWGLKRGCFKVIFTVDKVRFTGYNPVCNLVYYARARGLGVDNILGITLWVWFKVGGTVSL